ncbi:hypothetical protein BpHYR1_015351, partial [Brachionus plicatilis]
MRCTYSSKLVVLAPATADEAKRNNLASRTRLVESSMTPSFTFVAYSLLNSSKSSWLIFLIMS